MNNQHLIYKPKPQPLKLYHYAIESLLNCTPCVPSYLRVLPIIDTSLIRVFNLFNKCFTPLYLAKNTVVSVSPRTEKFDVVSTNHGHAQSWTFSVLDWKHLFWPNLAQKIKIKSLSWPRAILSLPRSIQICRIQW